MKRLANNQIKYHHTHPNRFKQDELCIFIGEVQRHTSQCQRQLRFYCLVGICYKLTDLCWKERTLLVLQRKREETLPSSSEGNNGREKWLKKRSPFTSPPPPIFFHSSYLSSLITSPIHIHHISTIYKILLPKAGAAKEFPP